MSSHVTQIKSENSFLEIMNSMGHEQVIFAMIKKQD